MQVTHELTIFSFYTEGVHENLSLC